MHPQSNGLVEQVDGTMEKMIASISAQFNSSDCDSLLPKIIYNLNTQHSSGKYF